MVAESPVERQLLNLNLFFWTAVHLPFWCQNNISWKTVPLNSLSDTNLCWVSVSISHPLCDWSQAPKQSTDGPSCFDPVCFAHSISWALSQCMPYVPATLHFSPSPNIANTSLCLPLAMPGLLCAQHLLYLLQAFAQTTPFQLLGEVSHLCLYPLIILLISEKGHYISVHISHYLYVCLHE